MEPNMPIRTMRRLLQGGVPSAYRLSHWNNGKCPERGNQYTTVWTVYWHNHGVAVFDSVADLSVFCAKRGLTLGDFIGLQA